MAFEKDTGYNGGVIRSLGGVAGRPGTGIEVEYSQITTTAIPGIYLPSNPRRVYMWFQNIGTNPAQFGPGANTNMRLAPGESYMIDALNPWTGQIHIMLDTAATTINVLEAQVQAV